jgi:uncharacterized cupredoxin-like copper-binding protein
MAGPSGAVLASRPCHPEENAQVITRRSLLSLSASALLAAAVTAPVLAQSSSPVEPAASVPAGPAITVVATDYHFGGLPTTVPVGTTLSLVNEGQELHELVMFRKNDGVTQSFEELLQLPDEEALQYVTMVGEMPLFAAPGQTAEGVLALTQEGEYIALCFIPQGMTEFPSESADPSSFPSGPPHFALGMVQTFTVTAAGTEPGPLPSTMPMEHPAESPAA